MDSNLAHPQCRAPLATAPSHPHGACGDVLTPLRFLQRSASVYGHKVAVRYHSLQYTYRQLHARVLQFASALVKKGVVTGDRVAIISRNTPPMLEAHYAVPFVGAAIVPVNCRITVAEVEYIVKFAAPKIFIVDCEFHGMITSIASSLSEVVQQFVTINDAFYLLSATATPKMEVPTLRINGGLTYEEFLALGLADPFEDKVTDEWQVMSINFTSGTTGNPKGVMICHRGAYLNTLDEIIQLQLTSSSVYLWTLPMFHANGWNFTYAVVAAGATSICIRKVDPEEVHSLIQSPINPVTHMCAAPVVCADIVQFAEKHQIIRLKTPPTIYIASAPPSVAVFEAMEKLGINLIHCYGLTEVCGPNTVCAHQQEWDQLSPKERALKKSRQGVPYITSHHMNVVDPTTMKPVARDGGTVGEIVMRGNSIMLGYYKDPEATARAFAHGWFHTGDLAVIHPDNYVEIMDRSKDIIISGGENISSLQVERVLCQHGKVKECVVIAVPDERWGEVPKAFVALKDEFCASASTSEVVAELVAHCRTLLPGFKVPKKFDILDAIPRTSLGKPNKQLLRDQEWRGHAKLVH